MSCHRLIRWIKDRLGKRELQHDLAFIVGHFEGCVQHSRLAAFGLQQLPDRCPRDFPGVIGIAQILAFGVKDQFVSDAGVEIIFWHDGGP
jgi:hypothetical protein